MQVTVVTNDNLKREELDASKILKLDVRVGETVFSIRERDGELCISIDGQLAIKPIGANLISLSSGRIG